MEREFIAHHIKEDSGLEHLIASMQPKKGLGRLLEALDGLLDDLTDSRGNQNIRRRLQKHSTPTELDYEELGGLSDPGKRDCSQAWTILE